MLTITAVVPMLARWLLGLGIVAALAANVSHGLGHGIIGAVVGGRARRVVRTHDNDHPCRADTDGSTSSA
jgi:hypothetical protein